MKTAFLVFAVAGAFAAVSVAAAPQPAQHHPPAGQRANYGYDKAHRVTPQERAKWNAQHGGNQASGSKPDRSGLDSDGNRRTNNGKDAPLLNKIRLSTQANTSN